MIDLSEMTLMEKVAHVKGTVNCLDVLDLFEIESDHGKIRSPFNEADNTPSCHVYEDHFWDFSTGRGGDVIDLAMALTGWPWGRVINKLAAGAERLEADPDRVRRSEPAEPLNMGPQLQEIAMRWAHQVETGLGVAMTTMPPEQWLDDMAARIPGVSAGHFFYLFDKRDLFVRNDDQALLIPHRHNGIVTGVKVRNLDGSKRALDGSVFSVGLYSASEVPAHQNCVIVEGESDCWALDDYLSSGPGDWPDVYALPSGAGLWRDAWLKDLESYDRIYTAFDNDRAGKLATDKVQRSMLSSGKGYVLQVPQLFNDVREALVAGWEPKL